MIQKIAMSIAIVVSLSDVALAAHCDLFGPTIDTADILVKMGVSKLPGIPTYGKLSADWAQNEIGALEAAAFLDSYDKSHPATPSRAVPIGIIDGGFDLSSFPADRLSPALSKCKNTEASCPFLTPADPEPGIDVSAITNHGTTVAFLIAGNLPRSVGPRAMLGALAASSNGDDSILSTFKQLGSPRLINVSETAPSALNSLGAIAIVAAGNYFPYPMSMADKAVNGILVGSLAPDGLASFFSNSDPRVLISAPSDDYLQVDVGSSIPANFGGTSGATPLVTGAISNVLSLLPDITLSEISELIRRTAIPTPGTLDHSTQNGAGSLNALSMVRVAARLADHWPSNRGAVLDPKTYDFAEEAADDLTQAKPLLKGSCADQATGLNLLRSAFFLAPTDETRTTLAKTYFGGGRTAESFFYGSPSSDANPTLEQTLLNRSFLQAVALKDTAAAILAITRGASMDTRSGSGKTALMVAVNFGFREMTALILKAPSTNVNATDYEGETALSIAKRASPSDPQILSLLVQAGAQGN